MTPRARWKTTNPEARQRVLDALERAAGEWRGQLCWQEQAAFVAAIQILKGDPVFVPPYEWEFAE